MQVFGIVLFFLIFGLAFWVLLFMMGFMLPYWITMYQTKKKKETYQETPGV